MDIFKIADDMFFKSLKNTIKELLLFDATKYSDNFLRRRIGARLKVNGIESFKEYEKQLIGDKQEQFELLKNLTIHVTEFFRDDHFWDFCRKKLFKDIIKAFSHKHTINIWSAGCSTGQEPISILLTFLELDNSMINKIRIVATDINGGILEKARKAEYDAFGAKGLSQNIVFKYFRISDEFVVLKDEYKRRITYQKHDVLKDEHLRNIDVLFCRNTVIYFSKETKEEFYVKMYEALNRHSFFILGRTETMLGDARGMFKIYNLVERVYEKE